MLANRDGLCLAERRGADMMMMSNFMKKRCTFLCDNYEQWLIGSRARRKPHRLVLFLLLQKGLSVNGPNQALLFFCTRPG